jgi:hypothetical protein
MAGVVQSAIACSSLAECRKSKMGDQSDFSTHFSNQSDLVNMISGLALKIINLLSVNIQYNNLTD